MYKSSSSSQRYGFILEINEIRDIYVWLESVTYISSVIEQNLFSFIVVPPTLYVL